MHFGALIREILTASCGSNLRDASADTALPSVDAPGVLRTMIANLELAFRIDIPQADASHFRTVRDVLQCVRLRRWEQRLHGEQPVEAPAAHAAEHGATRPVFVAPTHDPRERFIRYTPRMPLASEPPPLPRSLKRL